MIGTALTVIRAFLPSTATLVLYGALIASAGGAVTWWSVHLYNKGYDKAIADVAAQDKEAVDAVNKALDRVRECRVSGGVWSPASGDCQRR